MFLRIFWLTTVATAIVLGTVPLLRGEDPPQLGKLVFPTSGSGAAQERFLIGVELLHNFEYEEAGDAFRDCQNIDPTFAMAYWGEAMCWNHPLWGEQDLDAGRAVLRRLERVSLEQLSAQELGFISAVRILFGKGDQAERNQRYLETLADLSRHHPNDHEIACFHALAMLGTCAGNRDTRVYMQAAGVLEDLYMENPRHPGVLHYLIHCYDDPVHAPLGLRAARTYASVARNSAHAQHMPAHIYLPLGMWDEMIAANEAAWQAGKQRLQRRKIEEGHHDIHALHALQWLQYGYLQTGRYAAAFDLLKTMQRIHQQHPTSMSKWYFALMRADYATNAPDWQKADVTIEMPGVELSAVASNLFANGLAAIRGDTTGAERALRQLVKLRSAAEFKIKTNGHHHSSYFDGVYSSSIRITRIIETQLEALILFADGKHDKSVARLQDAIAAEEHLTAGYGPPLPVKPSHELLAEVLLNLDRPREAERAFQQALARTPGRTTSLAGLAEAARRQGHVQVARRASDELARILGENQPFQAWQALRRSP